MTKIIALNRIMQLLIIVAVLFAVGYETAVYWHEQTRPWQPATPWGRMVFYYSFFTVLTNLLFAASCLFLLFKPHYDGLLFQAIRLNGLVGILITMLVYNLVLRGIHQPPTKLLQFTNELLHIIVPLLGMISWLIYGPYLRIDLKTILLALIPFFCYGLYIFIRGELTNQYPYSFINPLRVGYEKVFFNAFMVLILFLIFALLLSWIAHLRLIRRGVTKSME